MGLKYKVPLASTALSTTNSLAHIIPSSTKSLKITEIYLAGMGTTSAANDVGLYRISAAGTGTAPTAITPSPDNPAQAASSFTASTGAYATTQATLGAKLLDIPVNSNGGFGLYRPNKGEEIEIPAAALGVTLRSVSGTGNVAGWITVEEI